MKAEFDFVGIDTEDKNKIHTHFSFTDAPIMLRMYNVPREALEAALDKEESETGKRTYTAEDLDMLYSTDFEKMEEYFLTPLASRDGDYFVTAYDALEICNGLSVWGNADEIDKEKLLAQYEKMKEFFHEHGDTRFDARIDYIIEYVKQKF